MNGKLSYMKKLLVGLLICSTFLNCKKKNLVLDNNTSKKTFVKLCVKDDKITQDWRDALTTRQSKSYLDSLEHVVKPLSKRENDWFTLIKSKENRWNQMKDSLKVPFGETYINDTTYVYLGYQGNDDGFTYKYQTVCLDVTALERAYGSALDSVNDNRIDRIFAHEYTHVLHKEWARQNELKLKTFRDSILWEILYEGIGMYRSMSPKWHPVNAKLSKTSVDAFDELYPIFVDRLVEIETQKVLSEQDKKRLHKKLSRAPMKQKWGALPMGVWLAIEAGGNDENLIPWVQKGPNAVISLALKYLPEKHKGKFEATFKKKITIK
jgi:hypothetical protein